LCGARFRSDQANPNKTEFQKYKAACKFKFGIRDYPGKFDTLLLEQHGMYSAKNHGNNMRGVSRDHMLSITEGFKLGVSSELISHPANCQLITQSANASKKTKSCITLDELKQKIRNW
jgi:hypothetical protein